MFSVCFYPNKSTGKIIRENAFEHKKEKPGLNLTPA